MLRNDDAKPWTCGTCRENMQEHVDGTLSGPDATRLLLHVRGCEPCRQELEDVKAMFGMLGALPAIEPPADFDERILASVPYEAYREMAPLRTPRMPVILEEESLPALVRSGTTRIAGLVTAVATAAMLATGRLPEAAVAITGLGLLPEALVRLQQLGRRAYAGAVRHSETS